MQSARVPSGRVHLASEAVLLALLIAGGAWLGSRGLVRPPALTAFLAGYLMGMLFLSPDLDLARTRPARRWGWLAVVWRPYAALFRHRGLSHHVLWGPLTRIAYLGILGGGVAAGLAAWLGLCLGVERWLDVAWPAVAGVVVANGLHALLDALGRRRRRAR